MFGIAGRASGKSGEWFFGTSGKLTFAGSAVFVLLFCFLDVFTPSGRVITPYIKHIFLMFMIFSVLSLSLNFVSGYIGQISLGHAAFFGVGAYVSAYLTKLSGWPFWLALPVAGIMTALLGFPLSLPALRVKGNFLVVITYGFGEVLRYVMINTEVTGGPSGFPGIPTPVLVKDFQDIGPTGKEAYILMVFCLVAFLAFFKSRLEKSRVGYAFAAIREDEIAATSMGIDTKRYKVLAFVLGAFFAGLAGSMYASYVRMVSPELLGSAQSILILTMMVVGGARSIKGCILGAGLLTLLPELLKYLKDLLGLPFDPWLIIYGLLLVAMMRLRPQGIWGKSSIFTKSAK